MRTVLPGALADTALLLAGRRRAHPAVRHRHGLAHHHVPLPRPRPARPPAGAAAGHADLHHRLLLRGAARLLGPRAARAAGPVRLAHGQGLLVPRGAHASRRHPGAVGRALPLRLSLGAGELRAAVDLRARGGAHAGADLGRRLLVGGAAAGATGARRRRRARPDGVPQRSGRRAVPRRLDPDGQHLRDLAAALEPGRRGADRAGGAAVRAGAAGRRAGRARARASSITPPGAIAPSPSPISRAGAAMPPRRAAPCRCSLGFVAPFAVLLVQASAHLSDAFAAGFWRATRNSVGVAAVAAGHDRAHRPGARLRAAAGANACSCAPWCGRRASATPCRARCWRSAC